MSDFAYVILKDYEYDRDPQMGDHAGTYGPAQATLGSGTAGSR